MSLHTQTRKMKTAFIAKTLDELLALHDQDFIECAYLSLLGRPADDEGLVFYLDRLRMGISKLEILAQLRFSKEGKVPQAAVSGLDSAMRNQSWKQMHWFRQLSRHCRNLVGKTSIFLMRLKTNRSKTNSCGNISGLDAAIRYYKWSKYPLFGRFVKLFFDDFEENTPTERKIRRIENQLFIIRSENHQNFGKLEIELATLYHLVVQRQHTYTQNPIAVPSEEINLSINNIETCIAGLDSHIQVHTDDLYEHQTHIESHLQPYSVSTTSNSHVSDVYSELKFVILSESDKNETCN